MSVPVHPVSVAVPPVLVSVHLDYFPMFSVSLPFYSVSVDSVHAASVNSACHILSAIDFVYFVPVYDHTMMASSLSMALPVDSVSSVSRHLVCSVPVYSDHAMAVSVPADTVVHSLFLYPPVSDLVSNRTVAISIYCALVLVFVLFLP